MSAHPTKIVLRNLRDRTRSVLGGQWIDGAYRFDGPLDAGLVRHEADFGAKRCIVLLGFAQRDVLLQSSSGQAMRDVMPVEFRVAIKHTDDADYEADTEYLDDVMDSLERDVFHPLISEWNWYNEGIRSIEDASVLRTDVTGAYMARTITKRIIRAIT